LDNLQLYIESLIFTSSKAMTAKAIKTTLNAHLDKSIKEKEIVTALEELRGKYANEKYPFEIIEISGGFQFMTKGTYYPLVSQYLRIESKKKLSRAALETLAIISYKQPITKSVMESIRGVSCDYSVQKLLEKELIEIAGRAEGPGRPLLYVTSDKFMNHFGLKDLNDLPKIKEFELPDSEFGLKASDNVPDPNSPQVTVAPEAEVMEIADEVHEEVHAESSEKHSEEVPEEVINEVSVEDQTPTISDEEE